MLFSKSGVARTCHRTPRREASSHETILGRAKGGIEDGRWLRLQPRITPNTRKRRPGTPCEGTRPTVADELVGISSVGDPSSRCFAEASCPRLIWGCAFSAEMSSVARKNRDWRGAQRAGLQPALHPRATKTCRPVPGLGG